MEKNTTNFINEIKAEIEQLKARLGELEGKLEEYGTQSRETADFTDIEISVGELPEPVPEPAELPVEEDLPEEIAPVEVPAPVEAPAPVEEPAKKPRKKAEPAPAREAAATKPYAWMVDVPQASVKNIRSAISLQDRALFINTLFKEDFVLYDSTISALNAMESAQEAAAYIQENFPDWNLRSDAVYCFMMAVRKKLG